MSDVELGKDRSLGRQRDPLLIKDKDPKLRYLWANKKLIKDNEDDGWVILNRSQGGKARGTNDPRDSRPDQLDGTIQRRDAIVMVMPEEEARKRFDEPLRERTQRRSRAFAVKFAAEARKEGLVPFDESRETKE